MELTERYCGKAAILQHYTQFKTMMDNQDPLVTLKTMNPLIVFKRMLMKDQEQQVASWMNALMVRDMKQHVEFKIKEDMDKANAKGTSRNEDGHSVMTVFV